MNECVRACVHICVCVWVVHVCTYMPSAQYICMYVARVLMPLTPTMYLFRLPSGLWLHHHNGEGAICDCRVWSRDCPRPSQYSLSHCTHIRNMYLHMNQPLFAHCPMCLVLPPHCPPQVIVIDPNAPTARALEITGPKLPIDPNVVCTSVDNALHTCAQIERFWLLFVVLYTLGTTQTS